MEIKNSVIIITGASSGIGKATAELLAKEGAKVAMAARSEDKLKEIAKNLKDSFVVKTDMTKPGEIHLMVEKVQNHFGKIDVLINNAGRGLHGSIEKLRLDDYKKIVELNVYGPLIAMQAVIPLMKDQGQGAIVNISSGVSKMVIPNIGGYASTKYALNALTYTARAELLESGIQVTALYPGLTDTNFSENTIKNPSESWQSRSGLPKADTPEMVAEKVKEAIINGPTEQYMSDEQKERLAFMEI
ncbi:MAG: SDR family oxidoreductase [Patescibacteria group bacterium]